MKELLYLKDDHLKEFVEKIFVSYRETFSDAKKILDKYSIGIAHHKAILLLSLYEGITISEILKKLKVTKQSLNRILKDLIKLDAIKFEKNKKDTRLKHVYLSDKGLKLFEEIFSIQKKRIYKALLNSNSKEVLYFNNVLKKIINE
ncbi:MAG: MarR family transcriptional regulator [Candidatus Pelagibacter bacterium]|jgi:DNA-binding MarR family transcriptional regulator|nr:MarR family transcriptional regulator [Candidatus Pelagibacter sp.]MDP7541020.1 MarR family transcriptional regulator [Candidatus Pelagibacter bacterium]